MSMWDWDEQGDSEPPQERQYHDPYASHSGSSDYLRGYEGHQSQSDHSHHQHGHDGHSHDQHHRGHAESDDAHAHYRHGASPSRQNYGGRHESYEDQGHGHDSYGSQSRGRHDTYEHQGHEHRAYGGPSQASNMPRAPAVHSTSYGGRQGYGVSTGYESRQEHRAPSPSSAHGHESTGRMDLFTSDSVVNLTLDEIDALARTHRSRSWLVVLYAPWCRFCQAMEPNFERVARRLERSDVYVGRFRADGNYKDYAKQYLQLEHFPTVLFFPKDSSNVVKYNSENREVDALLGFVQSFQ